MSLPIQSAKSLSHRDFAISHEFVTFLNHISDHSFVVISERLLLYGITNIYRVGKMTEEAIVLNSQLSISQNSSQTADISK